MKREMKALVQTVRKPKRERCSGKYNFAFIKITASPEIKLDRI